MIPDFKRKLQGAVDLLFLFPRGVEPFSGERRLAIKTLIIVQLVLFPLIPITAAMVPPVGFESLDYAGQLKNILAHDVITLVLTLALNWQIAGLLEKRHRFWLALEVGAWLNMVFVVTVMIPLLLAQHFDLVPEATMMRVFIALTIYGFVVSGCMMHTVYRVSLPIIIGWMAANFCLDRETWNLLLLIQGMPLLK